MRIFIQPEQGTESGLIRTHPWETPDRDPRAKYYDFKQCYDFKERVELISASLEDFMPYATYDSIQLFYESVAWLTGPESVFDSDDCALTGIEANEDADFPARLRIAGRLLVFYRQLELNLYPQNTDLLINSVAQNLVEISPENPLGAVGLSYAQTHFMALNAQGREVVLLFFAWGDDEGEVMANLGRVFVVLFEALRRVNERFKGAAPDRPATF